MLTGDQILQRLHGEQLTFSDLAKLLDVSPTHIHCVAHRKRNSTRIARALAIAIGKPFAEVFSDQPQYHKQRPIADPRVRAQRIQATEQALTAAGYRINRREASR